MDFGTSDEIEKPIKYPPEVGGLLANFPALKMYIELPKDIFLDENFSPLVACFLEESGWNTNGIDITKYDPELRIITFTTKLIAPFACVQDICFDYPYKSFFIRSISEDKAILDLQTKRLSLKFEIGEENVTLIDDSHYLNHVFSHIVNQPMNFSKLLHKLQKIGVNIIPNSQHSYLCDVPQKEVDVENKALQELIMLARTFAVRNNKDNKKQGEEKILFEIRENLDFSYQLIKNVDDDSDWVKTAIWCNKCAFIKDSSKSLENDNPSNFLDNSTTHAMVSLIMEANPSIIKNSFDIIERMNNVTYSNFQNNMRRFLKTLRILSFS